MLLLWSIRISLYMDKPYWVFNNVKPLDWYLSSDWDYLILNTYKLFLNGA